MTKVLIVLTTATELPLSDGTFKPTGFWAEEFVTPFHIFLEHGLEIDVATPRGQPAAIDPASLDAANLGNDLGRALNLKEQLDEIDSWRAPLSLERVSLTGADYQGLFFPGGYGPLVDLAQSEAAGNLIKRVMAQGGIIGALCHGQAALLQARHEGRWLFSGYHMTCFSPQEERDLGLAEKQPWLLSDRLRAEGAVMEYGVSGEGFVQIDRQLYTGQNPASAGRLAWDMARRLKKIASLDKASCGTTCH